MVRERPAIPCVFIALQQNPEVYRMPGVEDWGTFYC